MRSETENSYQKHIIVYERQEFLNYSTSVETLYSTLFDYYQSLHLQFFTYDNFNSHWELFYADKSVT
jgi:hypothetical protein